MSSRSLTMLGGGLAALGSLVIFLRNRMVEDARAETASLERALDRGSCSHVATNGSEAIVMGIVPEHLFSRSTTYKEVFQWTGFLKSLLGMGSGDESEWTQMRVSSTTPLDKPLVLVTTGVNGNNEAISIRLNRPASELADCFPSALTSSTREESVSSASLVRPEGGRFTMVEDLAAGTMVTFMARIHYSSEKGWYVPAMESIKWLSSQKLGEKIRALKATSALSTTPSWVYQSLGVLGLGMILYGYLKRVE